MPYHYVIERCDYSDYSAGRVLYGYPGHPAFPVRLASEIFQRCVAVRARQGATEPCVLYDPCCGGAYHLSTLGFLHWDAIRTIIGSDINEDILPTAARNLGLLTLDGMDRRITEIARMLDAFAKPSHTAALESAQTLRQRLLHMLDHHPIAIDHFAADATNPLDICDGLGGQRADIVISDIPYGQHSMWQGDAADHGAAWNPVNRMLASLLPVLSAQAVVAIITDKRQVIGHELYRRVEHFKMGKRRIVLLQPLSA